MHLVALEEQLELLHARQCWCRRLSSPAIVVSVAGVVAVLLCPTAIGAVAGKLEALMRGWQKNLEVCSCTTICQGQFLWKLPIEWYYHCLRGVIRLQRQWSEGRCTGSKYLDIRAVDPHQECQLFECVSWKFDMFTV